MNFVKEAHEWETLQSPWEALKKEKKKWFELVWFKYGPAGNKRVK